jgi:MoaA/NifB/PqqE/SkfB family radical SAM enzyme
MGGLYLSRLYLSWLMDHPLVPPLFASLLITGRCNLRCVMCDQWRKYAENPELLKSELKTTELEKLIGDLKELGTKIIVLTGGEPFLRPDIFDLVKYAKKLDLNVLIDSNGTLITETIAKDVVSSGLDGISVSIDGAKPATHDAHRGVDGAFEKAIHGVRNLLDFNDEGLKVSIVTTITKKNFKELPKIVDLANHLGVYGVRFEPVNISPFISKSVKSKERQLMLDHKEAAQLKDIIDRVIEKTRSYGLHTDPLPFLKGIPKYFEDPQRKFSRCFVGYLGCMFGAEGNLYVCGSFLDSPVGNIKETSLKELWFSPKFDHLRKLIRMGICQGCYLRCSTSPSIRTNLKLVIQDFFGSRNFLKDMEFYLSQF